MEEYMKKNYAIVERFKKKAIGFKKIEGRTGGVFLKGNKIIIEFTCNDERHRDSVLSDLKLEDTF